MTLEELLKDQVFYVKEDWKMATEITLETLNVLIDKVVEQQNNWNELKKWLKEDRENYGEGIQVPVAVVERKMQELEGNNE